MIVNILTLNYATTTVYSRDFFVLHNSIVFFWGGANPNVRKPSLKDSYSDWIRPKMCFECMQTPTCRKFTKVKNRSALCNCKLPHFQKWSDRAELVYWHSGSWVENS